MRRVFTSDACRMVQAKALIKDTRSTICLGMVVCPYEMIRPACNLPAYSAICALLACMLASRQHIQTTLLCTTCSIVHRPLPSGTQALRRPTCCILGAQYPTCAASEPDSNALREHPSLQPDSPMPCYMCCIRVHPPSSIQHRSQKSRMCRPWTRPWKRP